MRRRLYVDPVAELLPMVVVAIAVVSYTAGWFDATKRILLWQWADWF
jgi:hypothetical protein